MGSDHKLTTMHTKILNSFEENLFGGSDSLGDRCEVFCLLLGAPLISLVTSDLQHCPALGYRGLCLLDRAWDTALHVLVMGLSGAHAKKSRSKVRGQRSQMGHARYV